MTELEKLAILVAFEAPLRRSQWSVSANIAWSTVERIRAELEARGIDWRKLHPQTNKPGARGTPEGYQAAVSEVERGK